MGWLVLALGFAIPGTILASHYGGLPVEYGLVFIWAAIALIIVLGLVDRALQNRKRPHGGSASAQAPMLARA